MAREDLVYLVKHGRADEIQELVQTQTKEEYPTSFPAFMEEMLSTYKVSRKNVAIRSGLSQDYTYKLLRGDKKTTERDYILAMCIAIGMNVAQTQHALRVYGMPPLNEADVRSHIILLAIQNKCDIDRTNEWLEKNHYLYLKTNPDMPSAEIKMVYDNAAEVKNPVIHYVGLEEIDREIEAEPCGMAPFDYSYWGDITVKDQNGKIFHVQSVYAPDGEKHVVLDEENFNLAARLMKEQEERFAKLDVKVNESENEELDPKIMDECIRNRL